MSRLAVTALLMLYVTVAASAQFETRGASITEPGSYSIALGDFNHDGDLDMAVASAGVSGGPSVSILLGKGDGTFLPATNYLGGNGPTSLVAADFNQDDSLDLAVANSLSFYISIFLGNGDGTFTPGPQNPSVEALSGNGDYRLTIKLKLENYASSDEHHWSFITDLGLGIS